MLGSNLGPIKETHQGCPEQKACGVAPIAASVNNQARVHSKYNTRLPSAPGQQSHLLSWKQQCFHALPRSLLYMEGSKHKAGHCNGQDCL